MRVDNDPGSITTGPTVEKPPRPTPSTELTAWTQAWWEQTEATATRESLCNRFDQCRVAMIPKWYDQRDGSRGTKAANVRTEEDDRRVRTPLIYLNGQQTVAQTTPEDMEINWKQKRGINGKTLGPEMANPFAKSMDAVFAAYTREAGWQQHLEAWVQEATMFPAGVLKVHFERSFGGEGDPEPTKDGVEQDGQDNLARFQQIAEAMARGDMKPTDPQVVEFQNLLASMGEVSELEVREGLVIQNILLPFWGFDPAITCPENLPLSRFQHHDVFLTKKKIGQVYKFKMKDMNPEVGPDGEPMAAPVLGVGEVPWTGVHPDDLAAAQPRQSVAHRYRPRTEPRQHRNSRSEVEDEDRELMVREIWDREAGMVYVFVEGVNYPVAKWVPERTGKNWFPFHVLVLNRVPGFALGVSDAELQDDEQARINRKRSDEEVARNLSLERLVYDSNQMDEKDAISLMNIPPGASRGIPLGGKDIRQAIMSFSVKMDPSAFDITADRQDMQRAASLPDEARGVTGTANFAKEVEVAAQGSAITAGARMARIKLAIGALADEIALILAQEVPREAALAVDESVVWPEVYSDKEARALLDQVRTEVSAAILPGLLVQIGPAAMSNPKEVKRALDQAIAPQVEQVCIERYGAPQPVSRETLMKSLQVHVKVSLNGLADRDQRFQALAKALTGLAQVTEAGRMAGMIVNPVPLLRHLLALAGLDDEDDLDEAFNPDPAAMAANLVQLLQQGGQIGPEAAMALIPMLMAQMPPPGAPAEGGGAAPAPAAPAMPAAPMAAEEPAPADDPVMALAS